MKGSFEDNAELDFCRPGQEPAEIDITALADGRLVLGEARCIPGSAAHAPDSVLTSAELAAITVPAIFILGSDDPYLSIERARPSIDLIQGARLYGMPGGHAPGSSMPSTRPS